jgi:hypothetical protein
MKAELTRSTKTVVEVTIVHESKTTNLEQKGDLLL